MKPSWRSGAGLMIAAVGALGAGGLWARAEDGSWSIHGQSTLVEQWHGDIDSPYSGLNSLNPKREDKHTATLTLFLDRRLWPGGELCYDPEVTQGAGLSGGIGVAGFPNGEATRAGSNTPDYDTARLFVRQTIGLGGGSQPVASDKNQVAGPQDNDFLTFTFGKFAASDIFDNNSYSHDSRTQFLNWALMDDGAWDYPADVKGYTGGFTTEWRQADHTLRWGVFMEPAVANERELDKHLRHAYAQAAEWEERYNAGGHPGAVRALVFWNRAHMGSYDGALTTAGVPDITLSRAYRSKTGAGLGWEQELPGQIGVFARAGFNDGRTETWAFTEIDRTLSAGAAIAGAAWGRPTDTLGLAAVANGLSGEHRRYLAAGGYGFIIGDGRLTYGPETIGEAYYSWKPAPWLSLAADYQFVRHPAYNRDRGPVSLFALRSHVEF